MPVRFGEEVQALPREGLIRFVETCPVFRIGDAALARGFWVDALGFSVDWEHRFGPGFPMYTQVSRAGLVLHLSEHAGDAAPGALVFVRITGLDALVDEFAGKGLSFPVVAEGWGNVMTVTDPFGNRIRFCDDQPGATRPLPA